MGSCHSQDSRRKQPEYQGTLNTTGLQDSSKEIKHAQQTQDEIEAKYNQFTHKKEALDKKYQIYTYKQDGKIFLKTQTQLDIKSINQKLKKIAERHGFENIQIMQLNSLRGGDYFNSQLVIKDKKITIKQMMEEMFAQKDKIGQYYHDIFEANKELKNLTSSQLQQFKQFKDKADGICVSAVALKNMKKNSTLVDIAFVIDSTGSMSGLFQHAKETCAQILKQARFKNTEIDFKFALITYLDHNQFYQKTSDQAIKNIIDFGSFTDIYQKIGENTCEGGDDTAEAVHDGLYAAGTKLSWRDDSYKYVWLIADAPPHGTEYHKGKCIDNHQKGCPCGINLSQIVKIYEQKKINLQFCPVIGGNVYNTDQVFRKSFANCNYHLNNTTFNQFFDSFSAKITQRFENFKKLLPKILQLKRALQEKRHTRAYEQAVRILELQSELQKKLKAQQLYQEYSQQLQQISKKVKKAKDEYQKKLNELKSGINEGYDHNNFTKQAIKVDQQKLKVQAIWAILNADNNKR